MDETYLAIASFIEEHHVLSLATYSQAGLHNCSLFYYYDCDTKVFVFASAKETQHIQDILQNSHVALNILLETKKIGEIRGVQIEGECRVLDDIKLQLFYFKKFPYAVALKPTLWKIEVNKFKLTDNRLGFSKKLIWP